MDDEAILTLFWARAESAIKETAQKYGRHCIAIAMNILHSAEDAEECVNDTYLKVWDAIPPARPTAFAAFIGRITRNLSLNRYKANRTQKRGGNTVTVLLEELSDCLPARDTVESAYDESVVSRAISAFLYTERAEARQVFVRRYWYAESVAGIASRFGMGEGKVKSMLFRTRRRLRDYLESEGISI